MEDSPGGNVKRATSLLRWYPKDWRARYGDEFTELLIADLAERPRSWRRTLDVARNGLVARLAAAGLGEGALEPRTQARTSLASLGCALAVFLAFGIAMWSQLTIGWQWSDPDTTATRAAMVVMSGAVALFMGLALLAAIPVAWEVVMRVACRQGQGLVRPTTLVLACAAVLIIGSHHFGNGWPGTGGHAWSHRGLVPGGVAAFSWASTLWVSSYWAHPSALLSFPAGEIAWMGVSPAAVIGLVVGATQTLRRLDLSPRTLRYEGRLSKVATLGMLVFLGGCGSWILDGGPGPRNLFHTGAIDVGGLVVMAAALAIAHRAVSRARQGWPWIAAG